MHPLLKIPSESLLHLQRAASWSVPDFQFSSPQQRKTAKNSTLFSSCFSWLLSLSFYMTKIHQVLQRENHQLSASLLCTSFFPGTLASGILADLGAPQTKFYFLRPIRLLRAVILFCFYECLSLFVNAESHQMPRGEKQLSECWAHFSELPFSLAAPRGMRDLSSPNRDRTHAPCSGIVEP